jgi:hypothetical protein
VNAATLARLARTTPKITSSSPDVAITSANTSCQVDRSRCDHSTAGRSNMTFAAITPVMPGRAAPSRPQSGVTHTSASRTKI